MIRQILLSVLRTPELQPYKRRVTHAVLPRLRALHGLTGRVLERLAPLPPPATQVQRKGRPDLHLPYWQPFPERVRKQPREATRYCANREDIATAEIYTLGHLPEEHDGRCVDLTNYDEFREAMARCRVIYPEVEPPPRTSVGTTELDRYFTFETPGGLAATEVTDEQLGAAGAMSAEELEAAIIADLEEQDRLLRQTFS